MKYSLRSLMIVVTLACLVCGRIGYLVSRLEHHRSELRRHWNSYGQSGDDVAEDAAIAMIIHHERLESDFRKAVYCPWTIVDESFAP